MQIIITLPDPLLLSLSKGEYDYEPIIQGVQEQLNEVRTFSWLIPMTLVMGYSHKLFTLSSPIVNWTFKAESAGLSHY